MIINSDLLSRSIGKHETSRKRETIPSSSSTPIEIDEMVKCFDADWAHKPFHADNAKSELIWCPNNGRSALRPLIDSAKKTLWI